MPLDNPLHHHRYPPETSALIDGVAKLATTCGGALEVGYSQEEEKLSDEIDSRGVCYALVKRWFCGLGESPRDAYKQIPVAKDVGTKRGNLLLKEQLISHAFIHRSNNYSEKKDLNPFSSFKSESVEYVNLAVSNKKYHLTKDDLGFISYFGKASHWAVSSENQKTLASSYCFEKRHFEAKGPAERYITYVYQHITKDIGGIQDMMWMATERGVETGTLTFDDSGGLSITETKSQEKADAEFAKQQRGALTLFSALCETDALVLITGGSSGPDHAIGAYLANNHVLFFDPNLGVFRWVGSDALLGFVKFLSLMSEVYHWDTVVFLGFLR